MTEPGPLKKKTETKGTILHGAQDARHIRD